MGRCIQVRREQDARANRSTGSGAEEMKDHLMNTPVSWRRRMVALGIIAACWQCAFAATPPRPEQIQFAPLKFEPPEGKDFRHQLPNGVVVYLAPSAEFPLVNISFTFRGGTFLDPQDKVGLAQATGAMIRRGGSSTKSAPELDEEFDFLA